MKKAELREGVRYFVETRPNWAGNGDISYVKTSQRNRWNCYTVEFKDGAPAMSYNGQVYINRKDGRREKVSLSAIRGEWVECVKIMTEHARARAYRWNDRGAKHEAHLKRKAERQRKELEAPIREEFFKTLGRISSQGWVSSHSRINDLEFEVMSYLLRAVQELEVKNYSQSA